MAKLVLVLTHDVADFPIASGNRRADVRTLINYLDAVNGGAKNATTLSITPNAVSATGTITIAAGNLADGNVVYLGSSSSPITARAVVTLPNQEFLIGADNVETATNLAARLSSNDRAWNGCGTAVAVSNVVTVTAAVPGVVGNGIGIGGTGANLAFSGSRLSTGSGTAVVDTF